MNIVELHERVRFWMDKSGSNPRFDNEDIDNSLQEAIESLIDDRYSQFLNKYAFGSFQFDQSIRDELWPLIAKADNSDGLNVSSDSFTYTTITDYRHMVSIRVQVDNGDIHTENKWYNTYPLTYNQKNVIDENPFRKPSLENFPYIYYIESENRKIDIILPYEESISNAEVYYLKNPVSINFGIEKDSSDTLSAGQDCIVVDQGTVYDGTEYKIGDTFTVNSGVTSITSGKVTINFVNTELPVKLHKDICKLAAENLYLSVGKKSSQ